MGKANRATRKELEEVIGKIIQELQFMRFETESYIRYKGDTIGFNDFLKKGFEEAQKNADKLEASNTGDKEKSDKKDRYKKVSIPPL